MQKILKIEETDNLIVALKDLHKGESVVWNGETYVLITDVRAKHKFAAESVAVGDIIRMYGVPVGKAVKAIARGEAVTTENIRHYAAPVEIEDGAPYVWSAKPDMSAYANRSFKGIVREDGRVGTANYWLVLPLVFCENRNVLKMTGALNEALGYAHASLENFARTLAGAADQAAAHKKFPNVDGIRPITVTSGCGGAASDCESLCDVLAAYADHPNVAGITVFSLGCEKSQIADFKKALAKRNPNFTKPALYYRQQDWDSEEAMMQDAMRKTYEQLPGANRVTRTDVPLSKLKIGVKCGGSDGFSGISANPAVGLVSDYVVALGGASVLAEFPELCGAEGTIVARCTTRKNKQRFLDLMRRYEKVANFFDTSISDNPSWGNIQDGLITDAIKSTGAAKKGGSAPVSAVLDYGEPAPDTGLSLSCTPGNDVDAVTGQVAAGCNVVLFTTGLGTPTGNPIVPVLKISTNSAIAQKLADMIDYDCGPVIEGESLESVAKGLFEKVIDTAGGEYTVKADSLEQYDFMFWKRSVDL